MSKLLKNLIIALGITVVLLVGYMFLSGGDESGDGTSATDTPVSSEAARKSEQILSDTRKVEEYQLDQYTGIFDERRFTSLKDIRVSIKDVPAGRENPFEPVQ